MAKEVVDEVVGAPGRRWSLRREWSRAFLVLLVLLAALAGATILGMRSVVGNVDATARRLQHEATTIEALSAQIVAHEEVGHKLLSDERVDRPSYLRQQQVITRAFVEAESDFPTAHNLRATIFATDLSWRRGLIEYGLWGAQLASLHGNHSVENPLYGASSDHTVALLAGLGSASLDEMRQELDHGHGLEMSLTFALGGSFVLALGVLMFYRRRMTRHLVRPIAALHEGVMGLQAGDFDHRIEVARRDELGEVAAAFNEMAGAMQASHLALTVRATHDPLTGLANRVMLTERLARSTGAGSDRRARQESLLFIDIDDFKDANDSLGHDGGDALLVQVANRLVECVRPHDLVTRLGGDEFAIVVAEDDDGAVAIEISERIMGAMRDPFDVGGTPVAVRVSIGIAQRGPDSGDAAELLRSADFAMYSAKRAGKGRFEVFDARKHDDMVAGSVPTCDPAEAVTPGERHLDRPPVVLPRS